MHTIVVEFCLKLKENLTKTLKRERERERREGGLTQTASNLKLNKKQRRKLGHREDKFLNLIFCIYYIILNIWLTNSENQAYFYCETGLQIFIYKIDQSNLFL